MKRNPLVIVFSLLLPYFSLLTLSMVFFSNDSPFLGQLLEAVFGGNPLLLLAAFFVYAILTAVLGTVCFVGGLKKEGNPLALAKTAVILKLLQIPAYVLIFAFGVLLVLAIFTYPIAFLLFVLDYVSLVLSGFWVLAAGIYAVRQGVFQSKDEISRLMILQFVFCADVVASIVFYKKLKKRLREAGTPSREA